MSRVPFPFNATGAYPNASIHLPMGVHEDVHKDGKVVQTPTSAYFVIDSRDRLQNASLSQFNQLSVAPWNNFRLQKPAALMDAFAKRINVAEIRFPWAIPNITQKNNIIYVKPVAPAGAEVKITVPVGFYTPDELVSALNSAFDTSFGAGSLVLSYDSANQVYTFTPQAGKVFTVGYVPFGSPESAFDYYVRLPSLLNTMGFQINQLALPISAGSPLTGMSTNTLYTDYVDICSDKLTTFANYRDGNSSNGGKNSILTRLYLADETSTVMTAPIGCRPFLIHRQFKNAKSIEWDSTAFIDWMDVSVYDQYGELVPLKTYTLYGSTTVYDAPYPDFQITMLASES